MRVAAVTPRYHSGPSMTRSPGQVGVKRLGLRFWSRDTVAPDAPNMTWTRSPKPHLGTLVVILSVRNLGAARSFEPLHARASAKSHASIVVGGTPELQRSWSRCFRLDHRSEHGGIARDKAAYT